MRRDKILRNVRLQEQSVKIDHEMHEHTGDERARRALYKAENNAENDSLGYLCGAEEKESVQHRRDYKRGVLSHAHKRAIDHASERKFLNERGDKRVGRDKVGCRYAEFLLARAERAENSKSVCRRSDAAEDHVEHERRADREERGEY